MNPYAEIENFLGTYLIPNGPWLDIPLALEYRAFAEKLNAYFSGRDFWPYRQPYSPKLNDLKQLLLNTAFRLVNHDDSELVIEALKTIQQDDQQNRLAGLMPLWTRLLQHSEPEIKMRVGQILIRVGSPEALQVLSRHLLDIEPLDWCKTFFTSVSSVQAPLRSVLLGLLQGEMSLKLLELLKPLLPAYRSWTNEYVERYRGPADEVWDQQVSQWLQTADPDQLLYRQVAGYFARHASPEFLRNHRERWNNWLMRQEPDFYKPALIANVRLLDSGCLIAQDTLTAALFAPEASARRNQIFAALAPRDFRSKKELWLRLLASFDEELKRQAQDTCLMPVFAGMDLEFWHGLWHRGETDALRLKGGCEVYLCEPSESFVWLIEYMPDARGAELKRIWKTFLQWPSRHTTLYALELLTSPRYAKHLQLRREAVNALGRLPISPKAAQALRLMLAETDLELQRLAALALARQADSSQELIQWCSQALNSPQVRLTLAALKIAGKLSLIQFRDVIGELENHPNPQIRQKVRMILEKQAFKRS